LSCEPLELDEALGPIAIVIAIVVVIGVLFPPKLELLFYMTTGLLCGIIWILLDELWKKKKK